MQLRVVVQDKDDNNLTNLYLKKCLEARRDASACGRAGQRRQQSAVP